LTLMAVLDGIAVTEIAARGIASIGPLVVAR
jgi:hypothetical protein